MTAPSPVGPLKGQTPRFRVHSLSKTFPGTKALDDVSLEVMPGEIHALVGGNGSGKSTLIKTVMGVHQGDPGGEFEMGDHAWASESSTPELAHDTGIRAVHQDLGVFADLSVQENLALGHGYETRRSGGIKWAQLEGRAQSLVERFEIPASPRALLSTLSQGARTQVAIARALQGDDTDSGGLLILDEPTSSLPAHEVTTLMRYLRRYADQGQAILYVSHRLDEVLALSDRVTVLRDGHSVGTFETAELDEQRLIELIVGRAIENMFPASSAATATSTLLEVKGLAVGPLRDVSFDVARGEIVGIAGLLGSGRTELLRAIFGDMPATAGAMVLEGKPFAPRQPSDAMRAGIVYVPENRARDAAFPDLSLTENLALAQMGGYWRRGRLQDRRMRSDARRLMQDYLVKASGAGSTLSTLSGGNQQKVILARWLRRRPDLMLLDEPTQGVDVGARRDIYDLVRAAVADGASALVVASDAEELVHVADRILLLGAGRIAGEVLTDGLQAEQLIKLIYRANAEG